MGNLYIFDFFLFHSSNLRKLKSYRILRKIPKISFLNCNKKSVISTAAYRIIQFKNIMQHDQSAQAHKSNNIFSLFFQHTATRLVIEVVQVKMGKLHFLLLHPYFWRFRTLYTVFGIVGKVLLVAIRFWKKIFKKVELCISGEP